MSKKPPRIPTPRHFTSPVLMEETGSGSSRNSDSPIHWETLVGRDSPETPKFKPSSWDNSDDELPLALGRNIPGGHIYSSDTLNNRKSVAAEINELKKQFFQAVVTETVTDIDDLREKLETSLRNDRRKSPARMRRRTKSSSSSSTVMDGTVQSSPRRGEEFNPQCEAMFDNMENTAPVLELDSRFYLDNFFAELRRKRISILESNVKIANERNEDFQEVALEDSDEFVNLSDCGYFNRSSRKLSQILEVEESKKDSDKDGECIENTDLFLKFLRKSEDSECSPLHTARSMRDEKLLKNLQEKEYIFKPSSAGVRNPKKAKDKRNPAAIARELGDEIISLTAKTGSIQLNSGKRKDVKKNNDDLRRLNDYDDDVNWSLIENLKLDLMKTSENPTSIKSSRREGNSGSGSRRSTKDGSLQSPKFIINIGKESARSLKIEDIKTPNSMGKNSVTGSDRSTKDHKIPNSVGKTSMAGSGRSINDLKSSCRSALQEPDNIILDLKSPSLASNTSNQSSELQHILLDPRMATSNSQRSNYANEARDEEEISIESELPYRSNLSESSPRSLNSRSSKSSRSNRLSSRATESRKSSQRSEKLENYESLIRTGSRRSSSFSPRAELELLTLTNTAKAEKSRIISSRNRESLKSTPQETRTTTPRTSKSFIENIRSESKSCCESLNSECILGLVTPDWMDAENIRAVASNRSEKFLKSQLPSSSEIIISESLAKATRNDYFEEQGQSRSSSRKSVIAEDSDNVDGISSTRSTKDKSRLNSYRSEERTLLNIPLNTARSDEVKTSGRTTDQREMPEESEDTPIQTFINDSESDRRLSVINEVSSEDIELSNIAENLRQSKESSVASSEGTDRRTPKSHSASHRSVNDKKNESIKPEPEGLWNDLIETFSADQNQPFNWQDNFLGFLNTNQNITVSLEEEPSTQAVENTGLLELESGKKEEVNDNMLSKGLTENIHRSSPKNEKTTPSIKFLKKNEALKSLDVDNENNLTEKIKCDNDHENLYYFEVEKTGNFGIGEFGDVTCWNLGVPHIPEEGKPKGDGDGILPPYHKETQISNYENRGKNYEIQERLWTNLNDVENSISKVQKSFRLNDDLDLTPFYRNDLKPSKSDNCIKTTEFHRSVAVDFPTKKNNTANSEHKPLVRADSGKRERRAASSISSIQYSSSECLSDETDNQDFDFESVRRTASLTDIVGELRRSRYEKLESNENLYTSRCRLFEKVGKEMQNKDTTNLNIFLARKKEEDKTETKFNWLILKQSRGETCHRESKKFKSRLKIDKSLIRKDSKEYLSFKSRPSTPVLNLKDSNCFQNFYKRVISVFCLTSNSSLPTPK